MLTELKNLGLNENEAKTYLAMLKRGPATMLEIAAEADINRPTAYVQIESLKKKGLASTQTKGKRRLFMAEDPSQLKHLLGDERKEIDQREEVLNEVLPELQKLFATAGERPNVRFFEGKEGIAAIREEVLKDKPKEILTIYSIDALKNIFNENERTEYRKRRAESGIAVRLVYTAQEKRVIEQEPKTESRYLSTEKLNIETNFVIFGDKVGFMELRRTNPIGIVIEDKGITHSMSELFRFVWEAAEKS